MKHIQLGLYGEPGVGKSVFAHYAPKRFFITTDANYQYLEEFGAKDEDHIRVHTWNEAKAVINDVITGKYDKYETFVVDLTEDLFKWCEYEYCKRNGYEHVSDVGFAKGYDTTRTEFIIEISKLLSLEDKNVILLMHGLTYTTKDRRSIEHTKHGPSNRIPDKVVDQIEGRVRMFLRCYLKAENVDGKLIKKRYLSLVPKENEFGIIRGVNENNIPADIPLDFGVFASTIGLECGLQVNTKKAEKTVIKDVKLEAPKKFKEETGEVINHQPEPLPEDDPEYDHQPGPSVKDDPLPKTLTQPAVEEVKKEVKEEVKVEVVEEAPKAEAQPSNKNAQLAALLAKLGKK